jgi:hypothetical protein
MSQTNTGTAKKSAGQIDLQKKGNEMSVSGEEGEVHGHAMHNVTNVTCPWCQAHLQIDLDYEVQWIYCKNCGNPIPIFY